MTIHELLSRCDDAGIELWADGANLRYRGDADLLDADALAVLKGRKPEILAMLNAPADREHCLVAAREHGYPRVPIRPGESVMPGQSAWERFTANATIADVLIAVAGFGVQGSGFGVQGSGFGVKGRNS